MNSPQLEIHNSGFSSFFSVQAPQTSNLCITYCGSEKIDAMPFVFHQSVANATWQTVFNSSISFPIYMYLKFKNYAKQYGKPLTTCTSSETTVCTGHSHPWPRQAAREQPVKLRARRNRVHMLWVALAHTCIITELNNLRVECTSVLTKEKVH